MLAYQHAYHAGNVADIHKHIALNALLARLHAKASAITCVDTHAGRGIYPLDAQETQRGGEYVTGVMPLWEQRKTLAEQSPVLEEWLGAIRSLNVDETLSCYPGSPWWFGHSLRDQDALALFELHPGEIKHLEEARSDLARNVQVTYGDGPETLLHQLPFPTPRLCVLIDPSYEIKSEYAQMADVLAATAHKVRHAIVLVWYPLLPENRHQALLEGVVDYDVRKVWRSELIFRDPAAGRGMYGSGLLIMNPPWQLDVALNEAFSAVVECYGEFASHRSGWLVEE